jgi:hypothetical protein
MANQPKAAPPPPPPSPSRTYDDRQQGNTSVQDAPTQERRTNLAPGTQARLKEKADRADRDYRLADEIAYRRATEGCRDQETLDAVLALGGDATRSSPVREQVLPDADPGLTTTTGAYRSPIDPTTAAVPASEHSDIARNFRGTPTIGSGEHGVPEERWKGSDSPAIERLNNLPTQEELREKEAAWAADNTKNGRPEGEDRRYD